MPVAPLMTSIIWRRLSRPQRDRLAGYGLYTVISTLVFIQPLLRLLQHASEFELHSHAPLVPLISVYVLHLRRASLPTEYSTSVVGAFTMALGAVGALTRVALTKGLTSNDELSLLIAAFVFVIAAGGFLLLGSKWMKAAALPIAFLGFMIPLPDGASRWIEEQLVKASAEATVVLFNLIDLPFVREGTRFNLPRIALEIARECSGIRSTWVLVMTSVVAAQMFLTGFWRRWALVAFVVPLGIVRNGIRVTVIGWVCVHIGPHMIDSPIHHRGGPIFFVLSLIPFCVLLTWLRRRESAQ
jgi:exosortase